MHSNVKFVRRDEDIKVNMGAVVISIYPGGGRLHLSSCPGEGGVEKKSPPTPPEDNFWNSPN